MLALDAQGIFKAGRRYVGRTIHAGILDFPVFIISLLRDEAD
jgi:hypothetical protein